MTTSADGQRWQRTLTWLGFIQPTDGRPRSRWARVVLADHDSSARETAAGVAISVMLFVLIASWMFSGPVWHRVFFGMAAVLYGWSATRILMRRRRSRPDSAAVDPVSH